MSSYLRVFGNTVRQLRLQRGLSQEDLAASSGLHRTYVGGIERGERNIGLINILRLAAVLDIQPGELFRDLDREGLVELSEESDD